MAGNSEYKGCTFDPQRFASPDMAEEYSDAFDEYIELRVKGVPEDLAVIEAFEMIRFGIDLSNVRQLALAIEVNPYVKQRYALVLASKDIKKDLWSQHESVNQLLRLVKDPRTRDSTRLNAIVHLNVICGYVVLDELTARRVDKTISEFKRLHATWQAAGSPTTPQAATTH